MKKRIFLREVEGPRIADDLEAVARKLQARCVIIYLDDDLLQFYPISKTPNIEIVGIIVKTTRYAIFGSLRAAHRENGKPAIAGDLIITNSSLWFLAMGFMIAATMISGMAYAICQEHAKGHSISGGLAMLSLFIAFWASLLGFLAWRLLRDWRAICALLAEVA